VRQVYFGFSHCPDICPEELDKMAIMIDNVSEKLPPSGSKNPELVSVFITCDPARDSPAVLKSYLAEFHPSIMGLTGTWEQIKTVCKLYRVYFSTPSNVKPGQDYLVDHSIYFYLMGQFPPPRSWARADRVDPDGDFVEAIGRQHTAEEGAKLITDHMSDWKGEIRKS
jgi:protein SCO1/2